MLALELKFKNTTVVQLSVILCFWTSTALAQCWTSDLSEDEQLAVTRETFETQLFAESIEAAKCYLDEFPLGNSREEMLYLKAESLRNSGKLNDAIKGYDELMISFPASSEYLEKIMFHKGVLQARIEKYSDSMNSLKVFLLKFPYSSYSDEAYYWLGYATSYHAELLRLKNKDMALPEFESSTKHFVKSNSKSLSQTQQLERYICWGGHGGSWEIYTSS
jgi:DNA uptake lipoprotein